MCRVSHVDQLCHAYSYYALFMSNVEMSHVTHINESFHTFRFMMSYIQMTVLNKTKHDALAKYWNVECQTLMQYDAACCSALQGQSNCHSSISFSFWFYFFQFLFACTLIFFGSTSAFTLFSEFCFFLVWFSGSFLNWFLILCLILFLFGLFQEKIECQDPSGTYLFTIHHHNPKTKVSKQILSTATSMHVINPYFTTTIQKNKVCE